MKKPFHYIYVYMYSLNDKIKGHTQLGTVIGDDIWTEWAIFGIEIDEQIWRIVSIEFEVGG